MTSKEIEKFIKKNIIGFIGDNFIQKGTYILINPVSDILGGICFERSAIDKNSLYIWWFVQPLFIPDSIIHLTFGGRLEHLNHNQLWSNLDSKEIIQSIRNMIESKKTFIHSLTEPYLFYDYFNKKNKENIRIYEALIYVSRWIESANWKQEIQDIINSFDDKYDISIPWIRKIKDDMINISLSDNSKKILEDNKSNLMKILKTN